MPSISPASVVSELADISVETLPLSEGQPAGSSWVVLKLKVSVFMPVVESSLSMTCMRMPLSEFRVAPSDTLTVVSPWVFLISREA